MSVTEALADWLVAQRWEQVPEAARSKAGDVLFDSVGAMIACSRLPEVLAIVEFLRRMGGAGECTMIGQAGRTSVVNAAMANGAMAHGDEVDPVHLPSAGGHVAAGPVPAALSVGEALDARGAEVLRAIVLGYEVGGRLMTIFYRERDYAQRRFYHTAVAANISSAVTAGLLLGLDRARLQAAMGLAAYQAAGPDNMTKDPAHMGKTFQVGAANRNGVTAAMLAAQGCRVPLDILDGEQGLFDAFLAKPDAGGEMLKDLGGYYAITDVMHKRYPVGSPNQTYLQGLFALIEEHGLAAADIGAIEVHLTRRQVHRVPATRHASISALAVCAIAAAHGRLDFYRPARPAGAMDDAAAQMQRRIRFVAREDWQGMEHGRHAIVEITTRGGARLAKEVWHQPMSGADLERKFHDLVAPRLGAPKSRRVAELLRRLPAARSVRELMQELNGG